MSDDNVKKWLDAAQSYADSARNTKTPIEQRIKYVAWQLEQFLSSEDGKAAMTLLKASGNRVLMGSYNDETVCVSAYYLGPDGLAMSGGINTVSFAIGIPEKPKDKAVGAETAVRAMMLYGEKKAEEVLPYIIDCLNEIANAAPKI